MPASTPAAPVAPPRLPLYGLIASLPFSDFLQTGIVAFSAAPVMGDIGASPEAYSLVATLYAVIAIGVIAIHRRLLGRLGWRRLVQGSAAFFAVGAVLCGLSGNLSCFTLGRCLMALGCASFMTAGRILVNQIPPSPRRFTGIKFFASGLAWGIVAGPLLGSAALAAGHWRAAFLALAAPAALIAALASLALTHEAPAPETGATPHPVGLLVLMGASFLLLHALQRSAFDFFSEPAWLHTGAGMGLLTLAGVAYSHGRGARPLIGLRALAQRRYGTGLGVFALCYLLLGANNTVLPVLLQRALGLPLELVGRYLAVGALAGVASWIALARLLPRHPGPTRYYLAGFGALLLSAWQLSRLSEGVDPWHGVVPALLCNGAFVIVTLATTAMQSFQTLGRDEVVFSHANQVKNILGQFGVAAGVALATLGMQWRSSLHYARLGESLSPSNPALQQTLAALTNQFATTYDTVHAPALALAQVGQWLNQEATLMGALDHFFGVGLIAGACLAAVAIEGGWRSRTRRADRRAASAGEVLRHAAQRQPQP